MFVITQGYIGGTYVVTQGYGPAVTPPSGGGRGGRNWWWTRLDE